MKRRRLFIYITSLLIIFLIFFYLGYTDFALFRKKETFTIYNGYASLFVTHKIEVFSDLSLKNKLQNIADSLSRIVFYNLPVKVVSIDTVENKTVATINLLDYDSRFTDEKNRYNGWKDMHLENPVYEKCTGESISYSFAQPKYKGQWIDGFKILY